MTRHFDRGRRTLLAVVGVLLVLSAGRIGRTQASLCQSATSPGDWPRFEVATIKPVDTRPDAIHVVGLKVLPNGRVAIPTATLKSLIATAFDLPASRLLGGEEWMGKEQYDVVAKAPQNSTPNDLHHTWFRIDDPHLRQMLQALLIDRFQLRVHCETRTGQVYRLVKSGKTIPLKPTEAAGKPSASEGFGSIGDAGDTWVMHNATMRQLANFAGDFYLNSPVVDQTGLSGSYDFKWQMLLGNPDQPDSQLGNKDEFLQFIQVMGLKLKASTGPVEIVVIDHAEHPSEN